MRNLYLLNQYRLDVAERYGSNGDDTCGAFMLQSPIDGQPLRVVASCGEGWEHVSVSRTNRCPNWPEMEFIKRTFFGDDECAMQLHVPISDHISVHPNCLHIWKPVNVPIPRPPSWMIA